MIYRTPRCADETLRRDDKKNQPTRFLLNRICRGVQQQFLIASRFVPRSDANIDCDRVFLFRFVARCRVRRGSTRKSCFLRLRGTRRKAGCEISDNRCSLNAIDEWIHRTAYSARPGSISLFPDFRLFFWPIQRYFVTSIVHCRGTLHPTGPTRVLFPQNIEISGLYDTQIQFDRKWRSDFDLRSANTGLDICARCVDRSTLLVVAGLFFYTLKAKNRF